jgi:hypothetical protein
MLVEMVDIFDRAIFHRAAYGDVVRHCEMLNEFAQANAPSVGEHAYSELPSHEKNGEDFIHPTHAGCIDLNQVYCTGLE